MQRAGGTFAAGPPSSQRSLPCVGNGVPMFSGGSRSAIRAHIVTAGSPTVMVRVTCGPDPGAAPGIAALALVESLLEVR